MREKDRVIFQISLIPQHGETSALRRQHAVSDERRARRILLAISSDTDESTRGPSEKVDERDSRVRRCEKKKTKRKNPTYEKFCIMHARVGNAVRARGRPRASPAGRSIYRRRESRETRGNGAFVREEQRLLFLSLVRSLALANVVIVAPGARGSLT